MTATRLNPQEWTETVSGWNVRHRMDGLVECRRDFTATNPTYTAWGAMYEALIVPNTAYPLTFAWRPMIRVEPYYISGGGVAGFEFANTVDNPYTTLTRIYAIRPTVATGQEVRVTVTATGKPA